MPNKRPPNAEHTQFRSGAEAVENGRKDGIASGEARQAKKNLREAMQILMDTNIAGFTLGEANSARKTVAKKKMNEIPKLKELVFSKMKDEVFRNYIWELAIQPSLGYAFSIE